MAETREEFLARRRKVGRDYYYRHRDKVLDKCRDRYQKDPAEHKRKSRKWKEANPEHALLQNCRANTRKRGSVHVCDLTLEEVKDLCAPMVCSVTGIKLSWGGGPWCPSIDRKDNSVGYTRSNVRLVCWAFNSMRGDWDDETVLTVALGLASMQRGKAP